MKKIILTFALSLQVANATEKSVVDQLIRMTPDVLQTHLTSHNRDQLSRELDKLEKESKYLEISISNYKAYWDIKKAKGMNYGLTLHNLQQDCEQKKSMFSKQLNKLVNDFSSNKKRRNAFHDYVMEYYKNKNDEKFIAGLIDLAIENEEAQRYWVWNVKWLRHSYEVYKQIENQLKEHKKNDLRTRKNFSRMAEVNNKRCEFKEKKQEVLRTTKQFKKYLDDKNSKSRA
jgi:hypothetical protein